MSFPGTVSFAQMSSHAWWNGEVRACSTMANSVTCVALGAPDGAGMSRLEVFLEMITMDITDKCRCNQLGNTVANVAHGLSNMKTYLASQILTAISTISTGFIIDFWAYYHKSFVPQ